MFFQFNPVHLPISSKGICLYEQKDSKWAKSALDFPSSKKLSIVLLKIL